MLSAMDIWRRIRVFLGFLTPEEAEGSRRLREELARLSPADFERLQREVEAAEREQRDA